MTQDNYTDATDAVDESNENELIRDLRRQLKQKDAELKARPDRATLEAELRSTLDRESAISALLIELGHPAGMSAVVNGKLGDAEASRETVADALRSIGYQVVGAEASEDAGEGPSQQLADLAKVTDLSSQVRAASQGSNLASEVEKIAQAQTPEELVRLASEGGWLDQR